MPFKALLKDLVSSVEGATGAVFLASDGEPVQAYSETDLERLQLRGAYVTVVLKGCRASASRLMIRDLGHLVLEYDGATIIVQELNPGYFILLELDSSANIGQAIYRIQPVVGHLRREIAA